MEWVGGWANVLLDHFYSSSSSYLRTTIQTLKMPKSSSNQRAMDFNRIKHQDSLLWSQWCPYYRGTTLLDSYCGPNGVLTTEAPLYWTATAAPVMSLLQRYHFTGQLLWSQWCPYYRGTTLLDSYCGPSDVLTTEVLYHCKCSSRPHSL